MRGNYQVRFCGGRGAAMLFSPTQQHYRGLGGVAFIGKPKQHTVTINRLIDGEYQAQGYQGEATISSLTFPQLELAIAQIVAMTED